MATVDKAFRIKNGLVVEGATATVNTHDVITKEIFDAKGDLLVGTGSNTGTKVAVGTNGYVLTADSSETNGVKWAAAPAVGSFETSIVFEGTTANDFETTLQVTDPTADRTITFPDVTGTVITSADSGTVTSAMIENGTIVDGDISASAAIGASKIAGTAVTQADSGTVTSAMIADGTIVDGDISASAAIAQSKISGLTTDLSNKASASDLTTHTGASTGVHGVTGSVVGTTDTQTLSSKTLTSPVVSGLALSDSSIVFEGSSADDNETTLTVANPTGDRTITLPDATGTVVTTGNLHNITEFGVLTSPIVMEGSTANDFELTISAGDPTADRTVTFPDATGTVALTNNKLDVFASTTSAELRTVISDETGTGGLVFADTPTLITPNIGAATGTSLVLSGDLTVNGTTTTINSTEITIDDKNLVLGSVATPTDAGADGGGITLKGATDKTLNWVDATDAWTSSEHFNIASGKSYYVNGTALKDVSETLTNKTITSPTVSGLTLSDASIVIEGSTANDFETTLTVTDPTGDRTITFPDATGTVALTSDITVSASSTNTFTNKSIALGTNTVSGTLAEFNTAVTDADFVSLAGTETLTNKTLTSPTLTTPAIGAATGESLTLTGSVTLADALMGSATTSLSTTSATVVDSWSASTYSSAKYIVQMKNGGDIEVLEVLVTVNGANNVYITEYADVQSNAQIGTTDADYSGGNVRLLVTATDGTTVKVHKTLIEA
jgi:hypothetical protein